MAAELHSDLDIELDRPVDVFAAIEQLGLILAFAPLGKVSGLYLPGHPSAGILLHEGHPRTRQRYTAGHELGHHVFEHAAEVDVDLEGSLRRGDVERWPNHEKEAEAFGAWFLMPRRLLRCGLGELGLDRPSDAYDVYALSLWLGTSYTATARQLATTRIIGQPEADAWARIAPRDLKQALAGELVPDDLHNDVWWLDANHNRQPVDARPGDRVVLTLDEIPASGVSWRFTALPEQVRVLADSYEDDWEPRPRSVAANLGADRLDGEELVGGGHPRSFVLEVSPEAHREVTHLALVKDEPWDPGPPSGEFEVSLSINPRLHGIQLAEEELVLAAQGPDAP
jgi:hypothetical protein